MRKFRIRKIKPTKIFTISPEQDRTQMLTKISADLNRYTTKELPEIDTIRNWVSKELAKSLTKEKVRNLFTSKD
ncbi:hypothetical protein IID23_01550 [Patescibacteria group bacterium]|nr:hypothetical protein [Patescibacteria group bacterium]